MNQELKIILLGSVVACLLSLGLLLSGPSAVTNLNLDAAPELWQMPGPGAPRDGRLVSAVGSESASVDPFEPKIFESLQLKGFVRGQNGVWSGIFQSPTGRPLILAPGMTREGITLVFADGKSAQVRCGALLRDLTLVKPQDQR